MKSKWLKCLILALAVALGFSPGVSFPIVVTVSPLPIMSFTDNNGAPLNGGKLFTYAAGSTTKQNTYTDQGAGTANQNPIILNARGEANVWFDITKSYKLTLSPSTDTDPPTNPIWTVDNLPGASILTYLPLTGGSITGPLNETIATVASSASSSDIWTPANVISYTGVAVATSFPAAPQAGTRRLLVCTAACAFTASANMLIRGFATGSTMTAKANAFVWVVALTTTQFQLEYSLYGSFTATAATGYLTPPTATWYYSVANGMVNISAAATQIGGTSNGTAFTITGFPAEILPITTNRIFAPMTALNAGSPISTAYGILVPGTATLTLYTDAALTGWTGSGTKTLVTNNFAYQIGP